MIQLLPLFVVFPLFGAFFITLFNSFLKNDKLRYRLNDITANFITFFLLIISFFTIGQKAAYFIGGWKPPLGINFVLDGLSSLMLIIINLIAFSSTVFSVDYMRKYTAKRYYYALFLLMVAGMNGVVLSGDFFNIFVFIEIASIASYALVAFGTEAEELEASFKYMVMGSLATGFILFGVAILYSNFGMLNIILISKKVSSDLNLLTKFAFFIMLFGFLVKGAVVPFHSWLPDAHPSAPAPISAMLSGVLIKAIGIYPILRIGFSVFNYGNFHTFLSISGIISTLIGGILMIRQKDMKRLMAYSSISNIGLILIAFGLKTELGLVAGIFHLFNHSIMKSLLFLTSGSVFYRTKTRNIEKLGGLKNFMPVTSATSLVGSLSISGLPPFNGFFSKLLIILACVKAGHPIYAIWAITGSILTLSSFMKVQKFAFYGENKNFKGIKEVPFLMRSSMVFLAVLCLLSSALVLPGIREKTLDKVVNSLKKQEYWSILK